MIRKTIVLVFLMLLFSSNTFAGLYSSGYSREQGTLVAAVEIEGKGIFNLIISVHFLRKPQDKKVFSSNAYEHLIDRLMVEWRKVALEKVLSANVLKVTDLAALKNSIETEIEKLASQLKNKLLPEQNVEVVFSISDFYLLEPKDK